MVANVCPRSFRSTPSNCRPEAWQAAEARARWTTSGNTTSTSNKVGVGTTAPTTGRVRLRVDATRAPVKVGDLLVTGDAPGVAMRSEPVLLGGRKMHSPGTIIGKALEPLKGDVGEILVLLSLQ